MPTLHFVVTDAGLAAATMAFDASIKITLSTFALGSGYGYTPLSTMTALQGTTLFSDTITSYHHMPDGSLMLECTVNDMAGTFSFGEIGIYTDTGILFAISSWPTMQTKYSSLGTSVSSTVTVNAWLRLAQSVAVFNVTAYTEPNKMYGRWIDVIPPATMTSSALDFVVTDLDNRNQVTTLTQKSVASVLKWSIQGNQFRMPGSPTITAVDAGYTWIEISQSDWSVLVPDTVGYAANYTLVVESASNYFRAVTSVAVVSGNVRITFTAPWDSTLIASGQTISVYANDSALLLRNVIATEVARAQTSETAIRNTIGGSAHTVRAKLTVASTSLPMTAEEVVMVTTGGASYKVQNFSKTVNLATVGLGGMDTGLAPISGYVAIYAVYNPTTGISGLVAQDCTSFVAPAIYGGANAPAGFTASWLVSVWGTNGSRQFYVRTQIDRTFTFDNTFAFGVENGVSTTVSGTYVASALVPKNAICVFGMMNMGSQGGITDFGFSFAGVNRVVMEGHANYMQAPFAELHFAVPQTLTYGVGNGQAPVAVSIDFSGYKF